MASHVLRPALSEGTAARLPRCQPSSANAALKPGRELVVAWKMEEFKQRTWEVESSAAWIFITIFVVILGLLIGRSHVQLH